MPRQYNAHRGTGPDFTFDRHVIIMQLDKRPNQGQSQAGAFMGPGRMGPDLGKRIEYGLVVIFWYTNSRIGDGYFQSAIGCPAA